MKKIIALILAAVMLLSLTACGGKEIPVSKEQTMAVMKLRDAVLK